jgi:hypothetical protein
MPFLLQTKLDRALAVTTAAATSTTAAAMKSGECVFTGPIVARVAYVALPIPGLVGLEVVERLRPTPGQRSTVTVMRIKAVVDVAVETVRTVKPGACSKKYPANKPIRSVIAVGRAVIWGIVEVAIGADRRHSNVDRNLRWRRGCAAQQSSRESRESKGSPVGHDFSYGF